MKKILSILLSVVLVLSVMPMTAFSAETESGSVGESYNLWLGSKQVTYDNKGDIFGDGKASFDSSTNTLTLSAPTINGVYNEAKIFSGIQLTVKGRYTMPFVGDEFDLGAGAESDYGLRCNNQLRLDGDFTFRGNDSAIYCSGEITVNGGSVSAYGGDTAMECNKLTIGDAATRVLLSAENKALDASYLVNAYIAVPENGYFDEDTIFKEGSYEAGYAVLEPKDPNYAEYDIWLGKKQITSKNKDDILGDGKASYDPNTNTVTLNEPTISGLRNDAKIYAGNDVNDLKIKGSYHMTEAEGRYGVKSACFDYFDGDFAFLGKKGGITYTTELHIDGGSLYAEGGEYGVRAPTFFRIEDGVSRIELKGNTAAMKPLDNFLDIYLKSFVITTPEGGSFKRDEYSTFYEADGTTIAKHVVIVPKTVVLGDVDSDGKINICDVTAIQRHVAEFELLTGDSLLAADTNGDGEVTIEDATHLQMYLSEYDVVLG